MKDSSQDKESFSLSTSEKGKEKLKTGMRENLAKVGETQGEI